VIKRRQKQRLAENAKLARKEAEGDFSHLKNGKALPQPTLPTISLDDDATDTNSVTTRTLAPSTYTNDYYNSDKYSINGPDYPPAMPAYNPYSSHQPPHSNAHFQQSSVSIAHEDPLYSNQHRFYDEENESRANLTASAAPFSQYAPVDRTRTPGAQSQHGYYDAHYDPHDVYAGRASTKPDSSRQRVSPTYGTGYTQSNDYLGPQSVQSENPYVGYSSGANTPQATQYSQMGGYHNQGGGNFGRAM
jgi:hypothetical protein